MEGRDEVVLAYLWGRDTGSQGQAGDRLRPGPDFTTSRVAPLDGLAMDWRSTVSGGWCVWSREHEPGFGRTLNHVGGSGIATKEVKL